MSDSVNVIGGSGGARGADSSLPEQALVNEAATSTAREPSVEALGSPPPGLDGSIPSSAPAPSPPLSAEGEQRVRAIMNLQRDADRLTYAFAAAEHNGRGMYVLDADSPNPATYTDEQLADMADFATDAVEVAVRGLVAERERLLSAGVQASRHIDELRAALRECEVSEYLARLHAHGDDEIRLTPHEWGRIVAAAAAARRVLAEETSR